MVVKPMNTTMYSVAEIAKLCQSSKVGKLLPDALYVHSSALSALDPILQHLEGQCREYFESLSSATIIKFHLEQPKISYLFYPDFDIEAHPILHRSVQVDWRTGQVTERDYTQTDNPPVLHRKETFVTSSYHLCDTFAQLTRQEEQLGLLADSRFIGTLKNWEKRLQKSEVIINGHQIISKTTNDKRLHYRIQRHRAAIVRSGLSKPVRCALEAGLFDENTTFFDYGCGHGTDYKIIQKQGFTSAGWDPHYFPNNHIQPADIVNLGYVINVIENPDERRTTLLNAWNLTQKVLIIAAQVLVESNNQGQIAYGDGIITRRNTFQKYYEQEELKMYIDQVLDVDSIPVALGIYFVFRDQNEAERFRTSKFRSRATNPRIKKQVKRFSDYQELLAPLMDFVTERGRIPRQGELPSEAEIVSEFGSLNRAFQVILQVTDQKDWQNITEQRKHDLLLYLALTNFGHRPKMTELPPPIQADIRGLFGNYRSACQEADAMLRSLGNLSLIQERCQNSSVGKKSSKSLTVHVSALDSLDVLLRLYESCASRTIGRPQEATLVKFHTNQPKISYLFVPDFDQEPHPLIYTRMDIDLRNLRVYYQDFDLNDNPPIVHRKDALVLPTYPYFEKFLKLTRQEEDWGLLDDELSVRRQKNWQKFLESRCVTHQGHRVVWRKDCDPYLVKLTRAQIRLRQKQRHLTMN